MDKKCNKYESLFIFRSEEELKEHLKECPDCRAEQEKMDRLSDIIQEVKPYYAKQRTQSFTRFKVACILCFGLFTGLLTGYFANYLPMESSVYIETTEINEYGMPIDSYGLIDLS